MGKKSATKVDAAPAVVKATKPLKKGKREAEDVETKVNSKKQKKEVIAAVQKEKAVKKAPKKVESSSDDSDSESEEEVKAKVPAKKVPVKAASSSDETSDDSSSDDEPAQKKPATNGAVAKKAAKDESSSEEESSDEEVAVAKKPAAAAKNGSVKAKAESSSEEDSSSDDEPAKKPAAVKKAAAKESSSEEESSEDESEDEKPAAKKAAPAKAASSSDSSEEDSDDESEDEKPAAKKAAPAKAAKKESSSDDSESDEESEEEETPKKKDADVEMVDAEQKSSAKFQKTPSTPATGGSKTIFVANLAFQIEQDDVINFFKEAGEVVDVRFATNREDGSFRGFGHVEFATAEAAQKALGFAGRALLGRDIRVDVATERGERTERPAYTPQSGGFQRSGGGGAPSIFVKGFDSSLPEDDIKSALSAHFASCGEITRVSVPMDRESGSSKGIAYLDFKDGGEKALELNGSDLGGWSIVVDEAKPRDNSGGGFNSGGRSGGRFNSGGGRFNSGGGRFNSGGRRGGRGRDGGRRGGRGGYESKPSIHHTGKKTTFDD